MNGIEKLRSQYPQYEDIADDDLARAVHRKVYSDMPFREYADKLGLDKSVRGLTEAETQKWLTETLSDRGLKTLQDAPIEGRNAVLQTLNDYRADIKSDNEILALQPVTQKEQQQQIGRDIADDARGEMGMLNRGAMLGQGQTLGFMDELAAGVNATGAAIAAPFQGEDAGEAFSNRYNRDQAMGSRLASNYREDKPWESLGLELTGALTTAGLGYAAAPNAVRTAAASRPLVAASITGAAGGALQGAGTAEDGERLDAAKTGGAVGAVAGPVFQKTFGVLSNRVQKMLNRGSDDVSSGMARTASRMDIDPEKLAALSDDAPADQFLAEALDGDARKVAIGLAGRGGQAQDLAEDAITSRAEGRGQRVGDAIAAKTGQSRSVDAVEATQEARKAAGPLFEAARKATVPIKGRLTSLIRRAERAGVSFKDADKLAAREGDVRVKLSTYADDLGDLPAEAQLSDVWTLARALESEAGRLARNGEQGWRGLNNTAREMRDLLKKASPEFSQGSKIWASSARDEQALELGEKVFRQGGRVEADIKALMSGGMSDSEKANFLAGVKQSIYQKTSGAAEKTGNQASRLKSGFVRDRLRLVFGDDAANEVIKVLDQEDAMAGFETLVNRSVGSGTAGRQEGVDALERVTSGGIRSSVAGLIRNAKRQLVDEPRDKLANFIVQADEGEILELAESLYGPASKDSPLAKALMRVADRRETGSQATRVLTAASSTQSGDRASDAAGR